MYSFHKRHITLSVCTLFGSNTELLGGPPITIQTLSESWLTNFTGLLVKTTIV